MSKRPKKLKDSNDASVYRPPVIIFTDGGANPNPGVGGFGAILLFEDQRLELSEGYNPTTNNRMEIMGMIRALEHLRYPCDVTIYSDSRYVIDTLVNKWFYGWMKNGWRTRAGGPVKNKDLWERLVALYLRHTVKLVWVKGHSGIELNEAVDKLATKAIKSGVYIKDVIQ